MQKSFFKGALVGGLSGAVVMVATTALAGSGIGGVFNLGELRQRHQRAAREDSRSHATGEECGGRSRGELPGGCG